MALFCSSLWLSNIPVYGGGGVYTPHLLYPFIHQWTFRLLPCPAHCKQCCVNIQVHISFWIIVLSRYVLKSRISGSCGNSTFFLLRNHHIALHTGCTIIHPHQPCRTVPFSPHPLQHSFADILMMAILLRMRCCLAAVLICLSPIITDVEHLFTSTD